MARCGLIIFSIYCISIGLSTILPTPTKVKSLTTRFRVDGNTGPAVRIGSSLDLSSNNDNSIYQNEKVANFKGAYELFFEQLAETQGGIWVGGQLRPLEMVLMDDHGDKARIKANFEEMSSNGIQLFIAPLGSSFTLIATEAISGNTSVIVAPASTSFKNYFKDPANTSSERRFDHLFGIMSDITVKYKEIMDVLRPNITTLSTILFSSHRNYKPPCEWVRKYAWEHNITLKHGQFDLSHDYNESEAEAVIKELARDPPDAVVTCMDRSQCTGFIKLMKKAMFVPKALVMDTCLASAEAIEEMGDLAQYLMGITRWAPSGDRSTYTGMSGQEYSERYFKSHQAMPIYHGTMAWAALTSVFAAVELANSTNVVDVKAQLNVMDLKTLSGRIKFNRVGMGTQPFMGIQSTAQNRMIPGQYVYPVPTWEARECANLNQGHYTIFGAIDGKCEVCTAGFRSIVMDSKRVCGPCPHGTFALTLDTHVTCETCKSGTFGAASGRSSCQLCAPGSYQVKAGSTECEECIAGSRSPTAGSSACMDCEAGKAAAMNASEKCKLCGIATYANISGSSQCRDCPAGRTTKYPGAVTPAQCICPKGSYFNFNADTCDACPQGMLCDIGSSLSFLPGVGAGGECPDGVDCTYPKVAPGYMSIADMPLRIYLCLAERLCPGGDPGTCAKYRDATAVACGSCTEGSYEDGDDCIPCSRGLYAESGGRGLLLVLVCSFGILIFIIMTFAVNKDISMQSKSMSLIMVMGGQLCTTMQTIALFRNIKIDWVGPLNYIFHRSLIFSFLSFDLRLLGLNCVFRVDSLSNFLCRQLVVPVGVFCVTLTLVVKKHVLKMPSNSKEEFTNTIGVLFSMFFISVVISAVTPFICYRHPGESGASLTTSPSVLCFDSDDHFAMQVIGIAAMLLLVVPFVALAIYGTTNYPSMIADSTEANSKRLAMFRFLFFRFNGGTYYYACIYMVRNLCLCFVLVVIRENAALQIVVMALVLLGSSTVQLVLWPWRVRIANVCDGATVNGMVLLLVMAAVFNNFSQEDDSSHEVLGVVLFGATMAVSILTMTRAICKLFVPRPFYEWFVCHHKNAAAAQARNVKILLEQSVKFKKKVFIDSDDLLDLDTLFDIVKCRISHLIVYLTTEILTRPWCAGEIVVTHKNNIRFKRRTTYAKKRTSLLQAKTNITCIRTLGFEFPSETQLNNLEDYIDNSSVSLVVYNITIGDVKRAYEWLTTTTVVELNSQVFGRRRLAEAIHEVRSPGLNKTQSSIKRKMGDDAVLISTDPDDEEATSTGAILMHYIERDVANITQRPPILLVEAEKDDLYACVEAISKCRAVVVVLTQFSLQCPPQLNVIVTAAKYSNEGRQHGIIPTHTPRFSFPKQDFFETELPWKHTSDDFQDFYSENDLARALKDFFNKISMYFATHASERLLKAQSLDIFARIPTKLVAAFNEFEAVSRSELKYSEDLHIAPCNSDNQVSGLTCRRVFEL